MTPKAVPATIRVNGPELQWLSHWPCELQRKHGLGSGTCRSPVKGEGRAGDRWCVSCQAREHLSPVEW